MKKTTLSIITVSLLLSPAFAEEVLEEIIVTSTTKLPQKIKNSTSNVTVITAEDIKERGYQSVTDVLSHTSGFSIASTGGAGQTSSIFIRGLKSDNLLVLIDGIPLTDYTQPSAAASIEHISLDSIEKIEIVKGAQSGIWGSGAASGTVNIITKGGLGDYVSISVGMGSDSQKSIGFDVSKKSSKGSLYIGMHTIKTDSFSSVAPSEAENDAYENSDFHIKASINLDKYSSASLFLHKYKGIYDFDAAGMPDDNISNGDSDQIMYGFGYRYQKDQLTIDAKIAHRDIKKHLEGDGAWGAWTYDTEGSSTNYSLTTAYEFTPNQSIQIGAEHIINKASNDSGFGATGDTFKNDAIFLSYNYSIDNFLSARTTFNAVVRYDKFDKFDNKATYRFGIKRECDAIEGLHSSANIYTGYKAPSLYQLANSADELTPESTNGYEISLGYKKYLNVTYFHNKIKDKIDYTYDPATFTTNYFNNGNGIKTSGTEVSSQYAIGDSGLIVGANWTHMIDYEDENGEALQRVPKNIANAYLDYYFSESSHVGLDIKYVSSRRDMDYSSWPASSVDLDSYTTVNLTYNTQVNDNLKINITAKNILDKEYETVKGYSTEGRSIYATIEYKF